MKLHAILTALVVSFALAASASAATVSLKTVETSAGQYDLVADITDDCGGLSFFSIELSNITSAVNMAPADMFGTIAIAGFTVGGTDLSAPGELFAGQNSTSPTSLIYGVGTGGSYTPIGMSQKNIPWDEPWVLLGTLTAETGLTPWDFMSEETCSANVFVASGDATAVAATVEIVPEPATMSLLVLGGVGALLRKKR